MKNSFRFPALILSLILCLVCSIGLRADIIYYGDFMGANVSFLNVQESSSSIGNGTGQVSELYGPPTVLNNSLVFFPRLFEAYASSMQNVIVDGQLSFGFAAKPGYKITGIGISEFGDFTLSTPFPGGAAFVADSISAFASTINGTVSNNSAFSQLHDHSISNGIFRAPWTNATSVAFIPVDAGHFTFDNTLNAAAMQVSAAFIKKKGVMVTVYYSAVPEPASFGSMSLLGLFAMFGLRRRK